MRKSSKKSDAIPEPAPSLVNKYRSPSIPKFLRAIETRGEEDETFYQYKPFFWKPQISNWRGGDGLYAGLKGYHALIASKVLNVSLIYLIDDRIAIRDNLPPREEYVRPEWEVIRDRLGISEEQALIGLEMAYFLKHYEIEKDDAIHYLKERDRERARELVAKVEPIPGPPAPKEKEDDQDSKGPRKKSS